MEVAVCLWKPDGPHSARAFMEGHSNRRSLDPDFPFDIRIGAVYTEKIEGIGFFGMDDRVVSKGPKAKHS